MGRPVIHACAGLGTPLGHVGNSASSPLDALGFVFGFWAVGVLDRTGATTGARSSRLIRLVGLAGCGITLGMGSVSASGTNVGSAWASGTVTARGVVSTIGVGAMTMGCSALGGGSIIGWEMGIDLGNVSTMGVGALAVARGASAGFVSGCATLF